MTQSPSGRRKPLEWFSFRGRRGLEMLAYMGMRLSGIALVVYLYLHLYLLKQLADGPAAWDAFVALAKTPLFLLLDVVLIAGILGHGLNGLRVAHTGFGFHVRYQRVLLMGVAAVAAVATVISAIVILFGMV